MTNMQSYKCRMHKKCFVYNIQVFTLHVTLKYCYVTYITNDGWTHTQIPGLHSKERMITKIHVAKIPHYNTQQMTLYGKQTWLHKLMYSGFLCLSFACWTINKYVKLHIIVIEALSSHWHRHNCSWCSWFFLFFINFFYNF